MFDRDRWIFPAAGIAVTTFACAMLVHAVTGYHGNPGILTTVEAAILIVVSSAIFRLVAHIVGMWRAGIDRPARAFAGNCTSCLASRLSRFSFIRSPSSNR